MNKEKQKDFTMRITQANGTQLVVITYDILIEEIEEAERQYKARNTDECCGSTKSAQRLVADRMRALDYEHLSAEVGRAHD